MIRIQNDGDAPKRMWVRGSSAEDGTWRSRIRKGDRNITALIGSGSVTYRTPKLAPCESINLRLFVTLKSPTGCDCIDWHLKADPRNNPTFPDRVIARTEIDT